MRKFKTVLAFLCGVALLLQAVLLTSADTTYTLTLNNTGETPHTFEIYQIFTGDLSVNESGQKVLSNIVWGSGVTPAGQTALGNAAEKAEMLISESDAKAFADTLAASGYLTGAATQTVNPGATQAVTGLTPGYYLIKDQDNSQNTQNGAYTAYLLQVVGDVTASAKLDVPSVEKKVQDINDSQDDDLTDNPWQDSADHDVGDTVPFMITGTLPSNYGEYDTYYFQFTDEMSNGLTYQNNAKVFVENSGAETEITDQAVMETTTTAEGTTLTITYPDLKSLTGVTIDQNSKIIVRYTALLNENAIMGGTGNQNTVFLTYSNNPTPGGTGTGTTPKDKVAVFTYQVQVDKVDENNAPLENAGFTLYKKDSGNAWQVVKTFAGGSDTSFVFTGLDDGDYKLVESTVPEGYNKMEDLEFTITATHDTSSPDPALTELNGADTDGAVVTLSGTQQASVSLSTGTIASTIVNKAGSVLPITGGIGTTIFYLIGGLLVVGAILFFITRKRMKSDE